MTFPVLFVCTCVLNNCHWVATQLQLNIYHIISYHIMSYNNKRFLNETVGDRTFSGIVSSTLLKISSISTFQIKVIISVL